MSIKNEYFLFDKICDKQDKIKILQKEIDVLTECLVSECKMTQLGE